MGFWNDFGGVAEKVGSKVGNYIKEDIQDTGESFKKLVGPGDFKFEDAVNLGGAALMFTPMGGAGLASRGLLGAGKAIAKEVGEREAKVILKNKLAAKGAREAASEAKKASKYFDDSVRSGATRGVGVVERGNKLRDEAKTLADASRKLKERGNDARGLQGLGFRAGKKTGEKLENAAGRVKKYNMASKRGKAVGAAGLGLHLSDDMPSLDALFGADGKPKTKNPKGPQGPGGGGMPNMYYIGGGGSPTQLTPERFQAMMADFMEQNGLIAGDQVISNR